MCEGNGAAFHHIELIWVRSTFGRGERAPGRAAF